MEMKEDETAAPATGERGSVGVEKRREQATVEAYAQVRHREQLDAPAAAGGEANLIVAAGAVARESEHAREERPRTLSDVELLQTTGLPVIDGHLPSRAWCQSGHRSLNGGLLMTERRLELHPVLQRDVDCQADGRCVDVDRAAGG